MENKIIITKDAILKVRSIERGMIIGFDIFKESLVKIPNRNYIEITEQVVSLLGSEEHRLRLATALCKKQTEISKMVGLSDRTVARLEQKYMNYNGKNPVNQKTQLTEDDVSKIKKMCSSGKHSRSEIADKFNVSKTTIRNIHLDLQSYSK